MCVLEGKCVSLLLIVWANLNLAWTGGLIFCPIFILVTCHCYSWNCKDAETLSWKFICFWVKYVNHDSYNDNCRAARACRLHESYISGMFRVQGSRLSCNMSFKVYHSELIINGFCWLQSRAARWSSPWTHDWQNACRLKEKAKECVKCE